MKKIISVTLVCVMLLGCVFALASCGKTLSGKYGAFEFSGNDVTYTGALTGGSYEGTYEIGEDEDGKAIITFTFAENSVAAIWNGDHSFSEGEEDGVEYIKIDGVPYTKSN